VWWLPVCADELKEKGGDALVGSKVAMLETGERWPSARSWASRYSPAHTDWSRERDETRHVGLK
jgi:hypothetical protein